MYKSPCKKCQDRFLGCHDKCTKYQDYNKTLQHEREARATYNRLYFKEGGNSRPSKQITAYRKGVQ